MWSCDPAIHSSAHKTKHDTELKLVWKVFSGSRRRQPPVLNWMLLCQTVYTPFYKSMAIAERRRSLYLFSSCVFKVTSRTLVFGFCYCLLNTRTGHSNRQGEVICYLSVSVRIGTMSPKQRPHPAIMTYSLMLLSQRHQSISDKDMCSNASQTTLASGALTYPQLRKSPGQDKLKE